MPKFRKRPLEIEAVHYDWDDVSSFREEAQDDVSDFMAQDISIVGEGIEIKTLEGAMLASKGDWVIRGVRGEFYPCKPDVFAMTYEAVE